MTHPSIDPEIALSYAAQGRALLAAGRDDEALAAFERAAWLAPDDPRIQWALANVLWRQNRGEQAVPVYERVIDLIPSEPAPRCNLAELLAVLGRVHDARVQIAGARAVAAHDPHLHFAEAVVRLAQRRPAAAEEAARKAVTSGILPKYAYANLGHALLIQGRGPDALAAYRIAREQCRPEDLKTMRRDMAWLADLYPELPADFHRRALALFSADERHG